MYDFILQDGRYTLKGLAETKGIPAFFDLSTVTKEKFGYIGQVIFVVLFRHAQPA
jgi:hypothetical protein